MSSTAESSTAGRAQDPGAALDLVRLGLEPDRHAIPRWHRRRGGGPRGVVIHKDFDDPLSEFDEP